MQDIFILYKIVSFLSITNANRKPPLCVWKMNFRVVLHFYSMCLNGFILYDLTEKCYRTNNLKQWIFSYL